MPAVDIDLVSGALVADMAFTVDVVHSPRGYEIWLSKQLGYQGSTLQLQLSDVVPLDDIRQNDAQVLGQTPCTVGGTPARGVVAIFVSQDTDPMTNPRLAWVIDSTAGRFAAPAGPIACTNEFLGI